MASKPTVCVDLDDVLAVTIPALAHFHNQKYATALTAHDFHSYEFHKVWGGSKEEGLAKLEEFVLTEDFARLDPIPDAAATLHELASHFRFIVVTARHLFLADKTKAWLEAHYPGVFDDVLMSNVYGREGVKRTKAELCASVGAVAFIDDNETYAHEVARSFLERSESKADPRIVILFGKYAWQHSHKASVPPDGAGAGAGAGIRAESAALPAMPLNVRRAHNWREVQRLLMDLIPAAPVGS